MILDEDFNTIEWHILQIPQLGDSFAYYKISLISPSTHPPVFAPTQMKQLFFLKFKNLKLYRQPLESSYDVELKLKKNLSFSSRMPKSLSGCSAFCKIGVFL